MSTRRGSVQHLFLLLVLMASLTARTSRLILSHTFIEEGVYSLDLRYSELEKDLPGLEAELAARFPGPLEARSFFSSGKTLSYGTCTLSLKGIYNNRMMLYISDTRHVLKRELELIWALYPILRIRSI
ncbi:hypothetical protein [Youngiibacter fragilis]|uniref:Uncharacterized protein n=1 Tax=Youngiibacter fragilis 232.1 TaxID=994573 RepID=V7IAQ6_9CLOT|nr:hypothetical protein [Youngiibacter fragilis]ETA82429.1 hypothetical protein T472_0200970 [Youngiibacter fragilis 232.1]